MDIQYSKDGGQNKPSPEITPEMIEAGAERLSEIAPDCLSYGRGALEVYLAMERARLSASAQQHQDAGLGS